MAEIAALIAIAVANLLTQWVKPSSENVRFLGEEDIAARKMLVQFMNLVFGAVTLVVTAYLLGEPLDMTTLTGSLESIVLLVLTYASSQGVYAKLMKK